MDEIYRARKITDRIHWVGAIDWGLREFHGYSTPRGTTYNAYLLLADKPTLIDTVKAPFRNEMLQRISSVVNPAEIKVIVSNHSEMDHTGALPEMIALVKPEKVYASTLGAKALKEHFGLEKEITAVKDGESVSLGNATLRFAETRMLHWPDSMITWCPEEAVLFSQDAFGMHWASNERFDDELDATTIERESAKYFANIILPYAQLVTRLLDRMPQMEIKPKMILPDHGPVWRDVEKAVSLYRKFSAQKPEKRVVVAYDTMWGSTARMAGAIAEGLDAGGVDVKVAPLRATHRSDVMAELLCAGAFVVGSPTMNNQLYPTVADMLTYARGLKPLVPLAAAFGSYGWSGEAVGHISAILQDLKAEVVGEVKTLYVPDEGVLARCRSLGNEIALKVTEHSVGHPPGKTAAAAPAATK